MTKTIKSELVGGVRVVHELERGALVEVVREFDRFLRLKFVRELDVVVLFEVVRVDRVVCTERGRP